MSRKRPRILHYSHDTYGLGHLRRTLAIAGQVADDLPSAHQLVLTGSMVAGAFSLPPRLDMVKLPALSKRSTGQYTSRALPLPVNETLAWRQEMILQAVQAFVPDLVLVDKAPAGVQGELLPALRYLKTWQPNTRLVLGMRDIEDDPRPTRAEWRAAGVPRLHRDVYDSLLLYGDRRVFDPVAEYDMDIRAAEKLAECGYLGRAQAQRDARQVRRELGIDDEPLVVVTVGGGGDGYGILRAYLDMLAGWASGAPFYTVMVTGPLMSAHNRTLLRQAAHLPGLFLLEFTADLVGYLNAADAVVSMAGYNTVCELLALRKRALLIPRTRPRAEQRLRAERLAGRGAAQCLLPDDLSPGRLAEALTTLLAGPTPTPDVDMGGLPRVAQKLAELLESAPAALLNGRRAERTLA